MIAAPSDVVARINCPTCYARLRIRAQLSEGSLVRCSACRNAFRYRPAPTPSGAQEVRKKEISCPGCSLRFVATISEKKVACPGCHARIAFRKSDANRRPTVPVSGPQPGDTLPSRRARTMLNLDELGQPDAIGAPTMTQPAVSRPQPAPAVRPPQPPIRPSVALRSSGWIPQAAARSRKPRPSRNGQTASHSQEPASNTRVKIAAALILIAVAIPAYSYFFGEVKRETVKGTVTFEGYAVVYGSVVIQGEDGICVNGAINADGTYAVAGVPRGKVRIAVHSSDPSLVLVPQKQPANGEDPQPAQAQSIPEGWFPLPDYCSDLNKSRQTVIVEGETIFNIELKQE